MLDFNKVVGEFSECPKHGWQYKFRIGTQTIILVPNRNSPLQPNKQRRKFRVKEIRTLHVSHDKKRRTIIVDLLEPA